MGVNWRQVSQYTDPCYTPVRMGCQGDEEQVNARDDLQGQHDEERREHGHQEETSAPHTDRGIA